MAIIVNVITNQQRMCLSARRNGAACAIIVRFIYVITRRMRQTSAKTFHSGECENKCAGLAQSLYKRAQNISCAAHLTDLCQTTCLHFGCTEMARTGNYWHSWWKIASLSRVHCACSAHSLARCLSS